MEKNEGSRFAVFRTDASPQIGTGHVMRSLALANWLASLGWRTAFAVCRDTVKAMPYIASCGHDLLTVDQPGNDGAADMAGHWPGGAHLLVADSYSLDARFEAACRPWADRVLVLDDLANRPHNCDVLLDPTPGRAHADYEPFLQRKCTQLLGPAYALLPPCFSERRAASLSRRASLPRPARVLIAFGGTDSLNATSLVLRGLRAANIPMSIDVLLGAAAPHKRDVLDLARNSKLSTEVFIGLSPAETADLVARADVAFGAIGTSSWERCCLGVPSVVVTTAENQHRIARALQESNAIRYLGDLGDITESEIAEAARALYTTPETFADMAAHAARLCDGRGVYRAATAIDPPYAKDRKPITLRPASEADCLLLLEWQRHPQLRIHAVNPKAPTEAEHRAWFAARLADGNCLLNIVLHDARPVGAVRLDREVVREGRETYEISVYVAPDEQGQGIATGALAAARMLVPEGDIKAVVLPGNRASEALFRKAGYVQSKGFFLQPAPVRVKT
jgi:UDP-2,4-diacetamido-2,4,6-trideoxy-beta-L-altropyranose hydrolase